MRIKLFDLIRTSEERKKAIRARFRRLGFARRISAAISRQRSSISIPVETDLIGSMAVDVHWRLYYNPGWLAHHSVEENATLLIHEVSHLLRDHDARRKAAGATDNRRWNTAGDCEINDDLHAEGLPLPGDPPLPAKFGFESGKSAETYYNQLPAPNEKGTKRRQRNARTLRRTAGRVRTANRDSGRCRPMTGGTTAYQVSTG